MMEGLTREFRVKRAISILNEAKSHDVINADTLPEDDDKKIKLADLVVKQAREARSKGENGPHVTSILFAAEVSFNGDSTDPDEEKYMSILHERIETGLPIPPEIEGEPPNIPIDITEVSAKQLRYMYGAFNACSARTNWLYAYEEAGEAAAKQIADFHEEEYIIHADRKDIGGRAKPQAHLKAEARQANPDIVKWRDREHAHSIRANRYKRLLDSYDNACERLSREWTFRQNEKEHS